MSCTSSAAHVTKRATLHTVASTRTRHAGNVGRWGYVVRENGAYNKTAPEVALTNNRGLTANKERLMDTILPAEARKPRDIRGEYDLTDWNQRWFEERISSHPNSYVYLVMWPEDEIVKAGITTSPKRWRKFILRGAVVIGFIPGGTRDDERLMLEYASRLGNPAFPTWQHAVPWLGSGGLGFTECFRMGYESTGNLVRYADAIYSVRTAA